jgi:hypothetical protein
MRASLSGKSFFAENNEAVQSAQMSAMRKRQNSAGQFYDLLKQNEFETAFRISVVRKLQFPNNFL